MQLGQGIQTGTKSAADSFSRFVEGQEGGPNRTHTRTVSGSAEGPDKDKQDFWDNFGAAPSGPAEDKKDFWDSFGAPPAGPTRDKKDFWDSFGQAPKGPDNDKKDFWDSFAEAGDVRQKRLSQSAGSTGAKSSIGTSAMKSGGTGPGAAGKKDDENWGEW